MSNGNLQDATSAEPDFEIVAQPARGFYSLDLHFFYVNAAGVAFLLRCPGTSATMRELDDLPDGATPAVEAAADDTLFHLSCAAENLAREAGAPNRWRMQAHQAEIERDETVVRASFGLDLRQIEEDARAVRAPSLDALLLRTFRAAENARNAHRELSNLRTTLRGTMGAEWDDSAPLPAELCYYRHRGNYRGAYSTLADLGGVVARVGGVLGLGSPAARTNVVRDLHLRGEVWTFVLGEQVHVFAKPGSEADRLLAAEDVPIPVPRDRTALHLVPSPAQGGSP